MSNFGGYAHYYDLLYRDKDYCGEAAFVKQVLDRHLGNGSSVLELGCGTGRHAQFLAEAGMEVYGVDLSDDMLSIAQDRRRRLTPEVASRLKFARGDVRHLDLGIQADAVISLFHVVSYQTTNEDLLSVFNTARRHLKKGGVFLFDVWYGPAVLRTLPETRIKRLEDEEIAVTRLAEPVLRPNDNVVEVHYQVFIKRKADGAVEEIREVHPVRYLFRPELEMLARTAGFEIADSFEWLTGKTPGFETWGVCFVARG